MSLQAVAFAQVEGLDYATRMPNGESFDPERATEPIRLVEGPGVKVGEDTLLHPVLGIETGAVSNVFYTNDANCSAIRDCVTNAGLLRVLFQVGVGSLNPARLTPSDQGPVDPTDDSPDVHVPDPGTFQYRADVRAAYDEVFSTDDAASGTGGLSLGATLRTLVNPVGPVSLLGVDDYSRTIRAANFETNVDTDRDTNDLWLRLPYHPRDRSFGGYLYYSNSVDVFERTQQQFADRFQNNIGIHPYWKPFPVTHVFADFSQGFDTGIGSSSNRATSYPTNLMGGIATLLGPTTTLLGQVGYEWLNYTSGADGGGITGAATLGWRFTPLGRVMLQYQRIYRDSINANFYSEHVVRAWAYQIVAPFVLSIQPEMHFREYDGINVPGVIGPPTRDDTIVAVIAGVSYNFRNWLAIGLDYRFEDVSTDYRYMYQAGGPMIDPSYTRHAILLGLRAAK